MSSLSVLLPSSLVSDGRSQLEKTFKLGTVARALAIFRVEEVVIYRDGDPHVRDHRREAEFISTVLRYAETPQYLRRLLFPKKEALKYVGVLPPLRTPHHPLQGEKNQPGAFREAAVVRAERGRSLLELGLAEKGVAERRLEEGSRVTVRLVEREGNLWRVEVVPRESTGEYWGYRVLEKGGLAEAVRRYEAYFKIGTSRYGKKLEELRRSLREMKPERIMVAFGGPYGGLLSVCEREGRRAEELFHLLVNTLPGQGAATVRTEEALMATLALLRAEVE
ncbi:MAG: RNA methyltransferase [Candidatus Hadarchaeales archaeon]